VTSPPVQGKQDPPEATATATSSAPRAAGGCGATRHTEVSTEVMNSTRVCAARELRLRDAVSRSLFTDSATNSRPVSAPDTAARAPPKLAHIAGAYPTRRLQDVWISFGQSRLSGGA
jgi:hypothetical protein